MTTKKKAKVHKPAKAKRRTPKARITKKPEGIQTLVSLVLDESGSMTSVMGETISSVNEYVESLKGKGGDMLFTLTKFNTIRTDVFQSGVPVAQATKLSRENYRPDGSTPLFDAVGRTIEEIDSKIKGREKQHGVLVVLVTDGEENSSQQYNRDRICQLIRDRQNAGWTFIYLGANQDAWAAATSIGINAQNAVKYDQTNIRGTMTSLGTATVRYATTNAVLRSPVTSVNFFSETEKTEIERGPKA